MIGDPASILLFLFPFFSALAKGRDAIKIFGKRWIELKGKMWRWHSRHNFVVQVTVPHLIETKSSQRGKISLEIGNQCEQIGIGEIMNGWRATEQVKFNKWQWERIEYRVWKIRPPDAKASKPRKMRKELRRQWWFKHTAWEEIQDFHFQGFRYRQLFFYYARCQIIRHANDPNCWSDTKKIRALNVSK